MLKVMPDIDALAEEQLVALARKHAERITSRTQGESWDDSEEWLTHAVELAHATVKLDRMATGLDEDIEQLKQQLANRTAIHEAVDVKLRERIDRLAAENTALRDQLLAAAGAGLVVEVTGSDVPGPLGRTQAELEHAAIYIAQGLDEYLNPPNVDDVRRLGFTLFVFDFGDVGKLAYVSNATRETMIPATKEWLTRVESPTPPDRVIVRKPPADSTP